jgi:SRSO17 transposase
VLSTAGLQFRDWSADYRIFEKERVNINQLFEPVRRTLAEHYPSQRAISVVLDDTRLHKTGTKVHGTKWLRDPLGPKFQTNFIWGQRFLQTSVILPETFDGPSRARAVPVDFQHCPLTPKPRKKATTQEQIREWERQRKTERISVIGLQKLKEIRAHFDAQPYGKDREIIASIDGGYTNSTVFRNKPEHMTLIGRLRKDAKIFRAPDSATSKVGRNRVYGTTLPTPEQILKDDTFEWTTVSAFAAGRTHDFRIKTIAPIRWRGAGKQNLRLVIIAPLAYRLSKNAETEYRNPAFLICSDTELSLQQLLQNYLWRWEIEVNFRDEKTLLGVGEAQTRTPTSTSLVPAFMVATYSYLQLASHLTYSKSNNTTILPQPLWRRSRAPKRITTNQMISLLRTQLWRKALGISSLEDFASMATSTAKSVLLENNLKSALIYAIK